MALNANALLSIAEALDLLGAGTAEEPRLELVINRACGLIERYCERPLRRAQYARRVRGRVATAFFLEATPVDVGTTVGVTVGTTAQTVWRTESDGNPAGFDVVVARSAEGGPLQPDHLYRRTGWWPSIPGEPYNILLSYWGGLPTTPEDLKEAAFLTVRKLFDDQTKSTGEIVGLTTPSGGVTPVQEWLPARAREILDLTYKRTPRQKAALWAIAE